MKRIIIICGYLAAGKSTFAKQLSAHANIPCFIKDDFKSALTQHIDLPTREDRRRFSAVTFDAMIYVAEQLMHYGCPLILEGNFMPAGCKATDEAGVLQALIHRYGYDVLILQFTGATEVLHARFTAREASGFRGNANQIGTPVSKDQFDRWCHRMDAFSLDGQTLQVNTTDFSSVDFDALLAEAVHFLCTPPASKSD